MLELGSVAVEDIRDEEHRLIIDMSMYDYDVVYHLIHFFYGAPVSSIPATALVATIRLADQVHQHSQFSSPTYFSSMYVSVNGAFLY